jgi:hypothetical protein
MITATSTLTDVAFAVCTALDQRGITAVLTGGSAATFYAPEAYQSHDLDFVITLRPSAAIGEDALSDLGFQRRADYYVHPAAPFPLEFPPGPLMVGDDLIRTWNTEHRGSEILHILTPTDCCRDRLASFLFWNDFSGLEQAIAVYRARRSEVDLDAIGAWCRRERQPDKYTLFERRIHN